MRAPRLLLYVERGIKHYRTLVRIDRTAKHQYFGTS